MTTQDTQDIEYFIDREPHDRDNPYVMISRDMFRDKSISPKAKGILGYLLSLPDDWVVRAKAVAKELDVGVDCIYSAIRELRKAGYCKMVKPRGENGSFQRCYYRISEKPRYKEDEEFKKSSPHRENPDVGNPRVGNPRLRSKEVTKEREYESAAPSLQEPQVSQAREEALKQLTLDRIALKNARSSEHTDETVLNAVARVLELEKPENVNALLTRAIEEKWKPKETSTIKPQKKDFEVDLALRLKALGAKESSCAALATALTSAYLPFLIDRVITHFEDNPDTLKGIEISVEDYVLSYIKDLYGKRKK